jgi:hypothetical protein
VFDFGEKQEITAVIPWNFGVSCKTPQIKSLGISFGPAGIFYTLYFQQMNSMLMLLNMLNNSYFLKFN